MTVKKLWIFAATLTVAAACGDDPVAPAIDRNDPGTGTSTLMVEAYIEGQDVSGGFVTEFEVEVSDAQGEPVSGATVTVQNSSLGTVNLLETDAGSGEYVATVNSFAAGDYRLDITRGSDEVRGAVVGGLSTHTITSPSANDTLTANEPFPVTWTRQSEAAGVDIETRNFSAEGRSDTGSFTIPETSNPASDDQRLRIWRFNEVDIAGALFGSELKLSIRNTLEPLVVQ
ncbi:MAG: carboxypeptidase-like regulatory domain-containing protein [Gemmatimonadota bacterium]